MERNLRCCLSEIVGTSSLVSQGVSVYGYAVLKESKNLFFIYFLLLKEIVFLKRKKYQ